MLVQLDGTGEEIAQTPLLCAGAATLHDDAEYDCTEYSGGDANDGGGFHFNSPLRQYHVSVEVSNRQRFKPRAPEQVRFYGAAGEVPVDLLGAGAAALHDDAEYDGAEHSSGDANDGGGFHCNSSFLRY